VAGHHRAVVDAPTVLHRNDLFQPAVELGEGGDAGQRNEVIAPEPANLTDVPHVSVTVWPPICGRR